MSRRRLRLQSYSSDEDGDVPRQHHQEQQSTQDTDSTMRAASAEVNIAQAALASTTLNPNPNYDFPSPPMEISDAEIEDDQVFVEVSDYLSPPSPEDPILVDEFQHPLRSGDGSLPPVTDNSVQEAFRTPTSADNVFLDEPEYEVAEDVFEAMRGDVMEEGDVGLTREVLRRLGLRLRPGWLSSCFRGLERSVSGFENFSVDRKAELCFGQFLLSDMNRLGGGVLPENVGEMHLVDLPGPFVLQVDEIVNMSCPLRQRYHKAAPGHKRCLKLSMTDGIQRVFGMEYRPIKDLDALAPAGLKVAICNVHVRHGLLMLVPEVIEILGGMVEELEEAHQRLVAEINKPPRGRRPRRVDILPLATRATNAAWPSTVGHERSHNPRPQHLDSVQAPVGTSAHGHSFSHQFNDSGTTPFTRGGGDSSNLFFRDEPATGCEQQCHSRVIDAPPLPTRATPNTCAAVGTNSVPDHTHHFRTQHSSVLHSSGGVDRFNEALHSGNRISDVEMTNVGFNRDRKTAGNFSNEDNKETNDSNRPSNSFIDVEDIDMTDDVVETMVNTRSTAEMGQISNPIGNSDDPNVHKDTDHPQMLDGNAETLFTYLSCLSAMLLEAEDSHATVKGKIKCFMTGVKTFQYQGRKTYELRAYVEDGSLISEILIDHSVVQDKVGYSPVEVNAAISSSDANIVSRMKEIMKQFRSFLVNFEGTMIVELKKSSPTPVAIEMTQGCPSSAACLLLRRIKSYATIQTRQSSEPIVLSP